ncbi:unnamed protein product [Durusdinium trenchii]|uniref:H(+)-exporting diphosphatase n=1 Tax=Durusdinium trenchii TaxID=1381693 RepID=A0ABP0R281_9DINO
MALDCLCLPKLVDPVDSFLCCLSLDTGVKLLMWPHLVLLMYTVATAIENLIGQDNGTPGTSQMFETIWSLIGIPVILAGLWGVYHRIEPHVRLYWYYLVLSFAIDLVFIVDLFILQDACVHLKLEEAAQGGQAFACGVARSISSTAAVVSTIVALYLIYVVWSWCEDADGSTAADAVAALLDIADGRALGKKRYFGLEGPDVIGPSMDATASIFSGASIFYGSVSSAVIGEAKAVGEFVGTSIDDIETYAIGRA